MDDFETDNLKWNVLKLAENLIRIARGRGHGGPGRAYELEAQVKETARAFTEYRAKHNKGLPAYQLEEELRSWQTEMPNKIENQSRGYYNSQMDDDRLLCAAMKLLADKMSRSTSRSLSEEELRKAVRFRLEKL